MNDDDPKPRVVLVAVDPDVPNMSRLADELEAEPILPYRSAIAQRIAMHEGQDIAVVVPMTRPTTVLEAARRGVHRIAAWHFPELRPTGLRAPMCRAAYAFVDLTLAPDELADYDAIDAGADPDRIARPSVAAIDRLFREPPRRSRTGGLVEAGVSLGLDALDAAGVVRAIETLSPDRGVNVVNYHRVLPVDEIATYCRPQMAISAPTFAAQLRDMAERRGFTPVERLRHHDAKDKVAITFDDGYEDNFRVALPWLERFSAPACIFLVTGLVGRPDALWWDRVGLSLFAWWRAGTPGELPAALPERARSLSSITTAAEARATISEALSDLNLADEDARDAAVRAAEGLVEALEAKRTMLSWDEVQSLARAGVTFGSHTRSHVPLDELEVDEAKSELLGSHADLDERLGRAPYRATALPRGRLGGLTVGDLEASFDAVMTTDPGVNDVAEDDLFVKRRDGRMLTLAGRHHPAKLRLELTGLVDRLRTAWYATKKRRPALRAGRLRRLRTKRGLGRGVLGVVVGVQRDHDRAALLVHLVRRATAGDLRQLEVDAVLPFSRSFQLLASYGVDDERIQHVVPLSSSSVHLGYRIWAPFCSY